MNSKIIVVMVFAVCFAILIPFMSFGFKVSETKYDSVKIETLVESIAGKNSVIEKVIVAPIQWLKYIAPNATLSTYDAFRKGVSRYSQDIDFYDSEMWEYYQSRSHGGGGHF